VILIKQQQQNWWKIEKILIKCVQRKSKLNEADEKPEKEYPVWRQPNIKIEDFYILGQDDTEIEELLKKHQFSWGFSEDGIHTWITNYTDLLECHWDGTPAAKYNPNNWLPDLFETTRFIEYKDYDVHIIVVPPEN